MYKNPVDPASWPDGRFWGRFAFRMVLGAGLTVVIFAASLYARPADRRARILEYWSSLDIRPGFRPEVLLDTPLSVQAHVVGVSVAIIVGLLIFALRKGSRLHRLLGWIWVSGMATAAITSLLMIRDFGNGVTPLHAFTLITVISLFFGLARIRRGDVRNHAGFMVGLFFGGLVVAGVFAFVPGRTMWSVFFGG